MNTETVARLFVEICPFRIGSRVRVLQKGKDWQPDWPGVYIVTGLHWDYQKGAGHEINVSLALAEEIEHGLGDTDGFRVDDLIPE